MMKCNLIIFGLVLALHCHASPEQDRGHQTGAYQTQHQSASSTYRGSTHRQKKHQPGSSSYRGSTNRQKHRSPYQHRPAYQQPTHKSCCSEDTNLVANGKFQAGFKSWTIVNQTGGSGSWFISNGSSSPLSGFPVPLPPNAYGSVAMSDQTGPGSHLLLQSVKLPCPKNKYGSATYEISFNLFIGNRAFENAGFSTPPTLDYTAYPSANQQARVDILLPLIVSGTLDLFGVGPDVVLENVYQTQVGSEAVFPTYIKVKHHFRVGADLDSVIIRFAQVDNLGYFQMGVDDVKIVQLCYYKGPYTPQTPPVDVVAVVKNDKNSQNEVCPPNGDCDGVYNMTAAG